LEGSVEETLEAHKRRTGKTEADVAKEINRSRNAFNYAAKRNVMWLNVDRKTDKVLSAFYIKQYARAADE
jgi:hypothetical protein